MIAPFFILYLVFSLFPMLFSLVISMFDWNGVMSPEFVGLGNYTRVLADPKFFGAIKNTMILFVITIPFELLLGLLTACALKDFFSKHRGLFQLFNFLPYITTPVAVGIIFSLIFEWKSGIVNGVILALGGKAVYWLGVPWAARVVVAAMIVWKGYGYNMVMFLAGLSTISDELYEAAKIDGANWWKSFTRITLPGLQPIFVFVVTTSIINAWKLFDEPQLLFSGSSQPIGGPERAVLTVVMRYYESTFRNFEFGYGSAIAYMLFLIIALFSVISVKSMNRGSEI
jgi:ABC-type sugar transport system permease subunit